MNVDTVKVGRTPWNAVASILFALLYGASPIDLIPELLVPLLGWLDDGVVAILMFAFAFASWRKWAKQRRAQATKVLQTQ